MLGYDDFKDDGETLLGEDPRGGRRARKLLSVTLLLGVCAVALLGVGVLSVLGVLAPLGGMLAPPLPPAPIASADPHGFLLASGVAFAPLPPALRGRGTCACADATPCAHDAIEDETCVSTTECAAC